MAAWFVLTMGALGLWGLWGFFAKLGSDNLTPKSAAVMQGMGAAAVAFIVLAFSGSSRTGTREGAPPPFSQACPSWRVSSPSFSP